MKKPMAFLMIMTGSILESGKRCTMYNSPITTYYEHIANQITQTTDNAILAKVQMYVAVNKEELLKALDYDRKQYEAGYNDGFIDGRKKAIEEINNIIHGIGNN